ncbi:uncharacterized protein LOC109421962 [Aedes albopictus]|uniref:Uncharacterized protein n=1 Tax=Aedes albopictus TaxID=7160 RepID=A0ABM2A6Y9_AEDAL
MSEGIVPIEFIDGTEFTLSAYNSIIKNLRPNPSAQNSPESQSVSTCASMDTSRTDTALEISSRSFGDASSSDVTGKNPESANRSSSNPGVRLYTPPERATRYKLHEVAMKPPVSNRNAGRFEHSIPKRKLSFASSELRSHNVTPLNWSLMNTSCISFSKIVSSTPLSRYGDPRNMQPLDLSVSCSEESPLDCSLRNEEIEPMNLVVKIPRETRPLPSTYGALNFVCHR